MTHQTAHIAQVKWGLGHMQKLTDTEREIIEKLFASNAVREEISLTALAASCHVAKSTVIKTVKKLGFSGFKDYLYAYQTSSNIHNTRVLPKQVTEGDFDLAVALLADCLERCRGKRNICYSGGDPIIGTVADYVNRKLNMFRIASVSSYDYVTFDSLAPKAGVMFFFLQAVPESDKNYVNVRPAYEGLIAYAAQHGYTTVAIIDAGFPDDLPYIDVAIKLAREPGATMQMFPVKVLMLFESALAAYSAHQSNRAPLSSEGAPHEEVGA